MRSRQSGARDGQGRTGLFLFTILRAKCVPWPSEWEKGWHATIKKRSPLTRPSACIKAGRSVRLSTGRRGRIRIPRNGARHVGFLWMVGSRLIGAKLNATLLALGRAFRFHDHVTRYPRTCQKQSPIPHLALFDTNLRQSIPIGLKVSWCPFANN